MADIVEFDDLDNGQVARRDLDISRPPIGVKCVHFIDGGRDYDQILSLPS